MPSLPDLDYERVVIHDNFDALYRFAKKRGAKRTACKALMVFNGRFIAFCFRKVVLISTGMGSAQTNCLVELLSNKGCRIIVKVGTCSALHEDLHEGDVIAPESALIDEGSTKWIRTKQQHDNGHFDSQKADDYINTKEVVRAHTDLRKSLSNKRSINRLREDLRNPTMWSVDSYDCFDGSPKLYSEVNKKVYTLKDFSSKTRVKSQILGVEMECAALFSRSSSFDPPIPAASLIVVSRTRERLLKQNLPVNQDGQYGINGAVSCRGIKTIEESEMTCIEFAIHVAGNWNLGQ